MKRSVSSGRSMYTPLRISLIWLVGTYLLFLTVGDVQLAKNLLGLTLFITVTTGAFAVGYVARIKSWNAPSEAKWVSVDSRSINRWAMISALYLFIYGAALLAAYGLTAPRQIIDAVLNPGDAYFYRLLESEIGEQNTVVKILTLTAALATPIVPLMIIFWDQLRTGVRIVGLMGVTMYCTYWLAIGTLKGLGDLVVFAAVAILVRGVITQKRTSRGARWLIAILIGVFTIYMVINQADRLSSQNQTSPWNTNPVVTAVVGEELAQGVSVTLAYPSHGYLGLSYNLDSPFVWTHGRGAALALDSYWVQYVGGGSVLEATYPVRTEILTGWPWDMYWSTIYPWLASDITFLGVPIFMALVGWWLAKLWLESIYLSRKLSLLLLCQVAILVAYVPANNQIGITRAGLITFATLVILYWLMAFHRYVKRVSMA